jgi:nucleoside-diphosphate-sugar epimerase
VKVVVTGAKGRVGQIVVNELMNKGYKVRAITHSHWQECPTEQISLDILDYEKVFASLNGFDALIHLAAIPSPGKDDNSRVFQNNVVGVYNFVLAAGQHGIKRIAIASSDCAFGLTFAHNLPTIEYLPVDEEHPTRPDNGYGISKVVSEKICDSMVQRFPGMSIATLRITNVTEKPHSEGQHFFKDCVQDPEKGPWNLWSYIDVRDCATAFRLGIETDLHGHEVFCIAAANTRTFRSSMELIKKYYPNVLLRKSFEGHESLEDSSKAERLLGFKSRYLWNEDYNIQL